MTVIGPEGNVGTIELIEIEINESPGDSDEAAHIINPSRNKHAQIGYMTAQQILDRARALQIELNALCGVKFVPSREPGNRKACEACLDIASDIVREDG